jgi:dephospho-CoA kinase
MLLGLTGPIAAGKSTVADLLRQRGAEVIDADAVYHGLLEPGSPLWERVVARFGPTILAADQRIDRRALGEIVYGDPRALTDLEAMTHPAVVAEIRRKIAGSTAPVVAIEAVKLAATDLLPDLDALWLIQADPEVRLRRLAARTGEPECQLRERLAASARVLPAGVVPDVEIENSGDWAESRRQVADAWQALLARGSAQAASR